MFVLLGQLERVFVDVLLVLVVWRVFVVVLVLLVVGRVFVAVLVLIVVQLLGGLQMHVLDAVLVEPLVFV